MISFGSNFDSDPQLPWAAETLNDRSSTDQMLLAGRLFDQTHDYYQNVMGPDNSYGIEAVRRIIESSTEEFAGTGTFADRMSRSLARIYPQKFNYIGDRVGRTLIDRGSKAAETYAITNQLGTGL